MEKLQIIETPDYVLAVSGNEYSLYNTSIQELINKGWIIAYQPKGNARELDLPLLPEISVEEDKFESFLNTEIKLNSSPKKTIERIKWYYQNYFKSANKRFSEEDLRKAYNTNHYSQEEKDKNWESFIQSLKQPKTPKWFVAKMERVRDWDKRDINGDYEAKLQFKTTTINNKTYLVGHYEF
jgi:hypothetical protein